MAVTNRPTKEEIVKAVVAFLKEELAPQLKGGLRFQSLISASLLEIVLRELTLDPNSFMDPMELERLLGSTASGQASPEVDALASPQAPSPASAEGSDQKSREASGLLSPQASRLTPSQFPGIASPETKEARLCEMIRKGAFDEGPGREALLEYLSKQARYKIQVDNPKW